MNYQQLINKIGYIDLSGRVSSQVVLTFNFKPFPEFTRVPIVDVMPPEYDERVPLEIRPTIIDPRDVIRTIALGGQVIAVRDKNNNVIYVTSYKKHLPYLRMISHPVGNDGSYTDFALFPVCTYNEQPWSKIIPWEKISTMAIKWTGDFLIFIDWDFDGEGITAKQYRMVPELQACLIVGFGAKL
jgi:hypothetical protein